MEKKLYTPVTLIIFKRKDTTKKVIDILRKVKPSKLYIVADAARNNRDDEEEKVKKTREYVENAIDWECEIYKNYATENMGCKKRVESGISWVLEKEESTIILEDDIVPNEDFFFFCQEMLERYKDSPEVLMVSGYKRINDYVTDKPYFFSAFSSIWGWATWRRAWKLYDKNMEKWEQVKKNGELKWLMKFPSLLWIYWNTEYTYRKEIDTWDYVWSYSRYMNHGLGIVPSVNLIENVGIGSEDATHTKKGEKRDFSYGEMKFPLDEVVIVREEGYDYEYIKRYYNASLAVKEVMRKSIKYLQRKVFHKFKE